MIAPDITVDRALAWGTRQLADAQHVDGASTEARRLLAHLLGVTTAELFTQDTQLLGALASNRYAEAIARRRAGEPLAYIVGQREFWTLTLNVTPDVLVPRPETELLVERALLRGAAGAVIEVADLGTGSGCVALALASERPNWRITASDVSAAALNVARANAARLGLPNIEFRQGDWCAALGTQRFAMLVSNPPYIGVSEAALQDPGLRHEPPLALTPGADALHSLRSIVMQAPQHLLAGGWLLLEHGATQATAVRALLVAQGFAHVTSQHDLAGHERVTEGSWRP